MLKERPQTQIDILYHIARNRTARFSDFKTLWGRPPKPDVTIFRSLEALQKDGLILKTEDKKYKINQDSHNAKIYLQQQAIKRSGTQVIPAGTHNMLDTDEGAAIIGDMIEKIDTNMQISFIVGETVEPDSLQFFDEEDKRVFAQMFLFYWQNYLQKRTIERLREEVENGRIDKKDAIKKGEEMLEKEMKRPFALHISNMY